MLFFRCSALDRKQIRLLFPINMYLAQETLKMCQFILNIMYKCLVEGNFQRISGGCHLLQTEGAKGARGRHV